MCIFGLPTLAVHGHHDGSQQGQLNLCLHMVYSAQGREVQLHKLYTPVIIHNNTQVGFKSSREDVQLTATRGEDEESCLPAEELLFFSAPKTPWEQKPSTTESGALEVRRG